MIDYVAKLQEIDEYIEQMSPEERARQDAKTRDNPQAVLDLVKRGDVVGVAVAAKNGIALDARAQGGKTALHIASEKDMPTMAALLAVNAPQLAFERDGKGKLPIDSQRRVQGREAANVLAQATYSRELGSLARLTPNSITSGLIQDTAARESSRGASASRNEKNIHITR